jgi:HlyD family secretion protein
MRRRWIILAIVVVLVAGAFFGIRYFRQQQQAVASANFQTVPAGRGELTATVGATGVVRANQTAQLAWQASGTVGEVNAQTGDQVAVGQVLASLELTSLPQTIILAQADLVSAQKALNDLLNSQIQQAQALQTVENAQQALEDARSPELVRARAQEALAAAEKAVENAERSLRWAQSPANQSYIDEAEAQVTLAKDRLEKAKEKYEPYENKPEDNLVRARLLSLMAEAQQQYDLTVRQLNSLQGTAGESDIALQDANLATAQAQLLEAQREWERVKDGPNAADIALVEAQLADAQREYERVKDGPDPADVAVAEARIAAAQATINLARIVAPFEGTITNVISKPGDQVTPGTPAFRLDDLSRQLVDVQVSEVDINRIQVGQSVSLIFDAILNKEYKGVVSEVSPVGTTTQGTVDFTVTVELTDTDEDVRPGMTAAVNMVVDQLENVLLVPNRAVRTLEGERVVYVLRGGTLDPVEIRLGASSEEMSQVLEGELAEGDQIVLNPPLVFDQNGPPPFVQGQ